MLSPQMTLKIFTILYLLLVIFSHRSNDILFPFLFERILQGIKIDNNFLSDELIIRLMTKFLIQGQDGFYLRLKLKRDYIINHKIFLLESPITPPSINIG